MDDFYCSLEGKLYVAIIGSTNVTAVQSIVGSEDARVSPSAALVLGTS